MLFRHCRDEMESSFFPFVGVSAFGSFLLRGLKGLAGTPLARVRDDENEIPKTPFYYLFLHPFVVVFSLVFFCRSSPQTFSSLCGLCFSPSFFSLFPFSPSLPCDFLTFLSPHPRKDSLYLSTRCLCRAPCQAGQCRPVASCCSHLQGRVIPPDTCLSCISYVLLPVPSSRIPPPHLHRPLHAHCPTNLRPTQSFLSPSLSPPLSLTLGFFLPSLLS